MLWLSLLLPKYEEDSIKIEGARGDLILVLVTFKNEGDPLKNNGARVATTFFSL